MKGVNRRAMATVPATRRMRVGCPDPSGDPKHPVFLVDYDCGKEAYKWRSAGACTDGLRIDLESRSDCGGHTNP